jgi:class 3 adenylate cyclase
MAMEIDLRDVLPTIRVPTLVLAMPSARDEAQFIADRIPQARLFEVSGPDFFIKLLGDDVYDEIERFVLGLDVAREPDTVLATVMFTDIADSTRKAAEIGDRAWAELVSKHHAIFRRRLDVFRGTEIDTAGDGFFASFEGPIRAVRCGRAITEAVRAIGLEVRVGLHTGECERVGAKLGGLAVNIGARVAGAAAPGEVLVSSTVKDLVAGSPIEFVDRGAHELKGSPAGGSSTPLPAAEPSSVGRRFRELPAKPVDFGSVVCGELNAGLLESRLAARVQRARSVAIATRERDRRLVERGQRHPVGIVGVRLGALGEVALGFVHIPAVDLDMAEVVQLDSDHSFVADSAVQLQALLEQRSRFVVLAGLAEGLRVQMKRCLAHRRAQVACVLARLLGVFARALVISVVDGDPAQAEVRQRQCLVIAGRARRLERGLVPLARVLALALPEREEAVSIEGKRAFA